MKRLLWSLLLLLCLYIPALAQKVRVFGTAGQTQTIRSQNTNVPVFRTFPSCTITVFQTGTLTLATIWTNAGGATPQANPFTAGSDATFGFFSTAGDVVDVRISGAGVTTPFTISSITVTGGSGGGGSGNALTSNPLSQFAATTPAQLRTVVTDDTGGGPLVFGTSPNITTPTGIVKGDVGLGNVDNTSDTTKNSAAGTLTNKTIDGDNNTVLDLPANTVFKSGTVVPIANLATGTPTGSKFIRDDGTLQSIPGGGDALTANPLSQFAATTSAQLASVISDESGTPGFVVFSVSPALTGTPTAPTAVAGTNTTQIATTAHVLAERSNSATLTNKTLTSPTINNAVMSNPTGITKTNVGLANVDNTSDASKPVSSATQTALNLKANLASPTFTGTPTLPTGTIAVTQSAGNSTTAVATTAFTTTADNLKANLASPTFTGTVTIPSGASITTPNLSLRVQTDNVAIVTNSPYVNTTDHKAYLGSDDGTVNREILVAGISGPVSVSNGGNGLVGDGGTVASAATVSVTGKLTHISGTTTITSVSGSGIAAGTEITLIFDGILTFTDGSNLKLAGNFVTSADDTITLVYDGTSWFETARSVN